jgi:hypothetical protein
MGPEETEERRMETLPAHLPGPVADKLSIWPLDSGQYGLDATFQARTGFERMEIHEKALKSSGVRFRLVQELGDAWTLRFGPISAKEVTMALRSFVH